MSHGDDARKAGYSELVADAPEVAYLTQKAEWEEYGLWLRKRAWCFEQQQKKASNMDFIISYLLCIYFSINNDPATINMECCCWLQQSQGFTHHV